jgi:hypothetical protein
MFHDARLGMSNGRWNYEKALEYAAEAAGAPSEELIEAMALEAHRAFWLRTYGEETGTAACVARTTWPASRAGRMIEARASYMALLQRSTERNRR